MLIFQRVKFHSIVSAIFTNVEISYWLYSVIGLQNWYMTYVWTVRHLV